MRVFLKIGVCLTCLLLATGCAIEALAPVAVPVVTPFSTPAPTPASKPSPTPASTAQPHETPFPTQAPPEEVTLGFVGDILMMTSQIQAAKTKAGYDFTRSFTPMCALFEDVDILCGNYEGAFGGEAMGYTLRRATPEPPSELNPSPTPPPFQTFSAPDALALNLRDVGFDVLTTANNHCLDRGLDGLYRTVETIRAAGLAQTGTSLNEEDRRTPLVLTKNGIRVGIVAVTDSVNAYDALLKGHTFAAARLFDKEQRVKSDIEACRAAGAEFIIVCAHWGNEFENEPNAQQRRAAKKLIAYGADAVIGSHPHVVQKLEFIEAERNGENISAFVAWSLGNFISNMAPSPKDYGLFVRLTLARDALGGVFLKEAAYLPVLCLKQRLKAGGTLHQTLPCYENASLVTAYEPLDRAYLNDVLKARSYVLDLCGTGAASLIG